MEKNKKGRKVGCRKTQKRKSRKGKSREDELLQEFKTGKRCKATFLLINTQFVKWPLHRWKCPKPFQYVRGTLQCAMTLDQCVETTDKNRQCDINTGKQCRRIGHHAQCGTRSDRNVGKILKESDDTP